MSQNETKPLSTSTLAKLIALENDKRLQEMALYTISNGGMKIDPTIKTQEEMMTRLGALFTQYKGLVKRGEYTMDDLEIMVFSQNGIVPKEMETPKINLKAILGEKNEATTGRIAGFSSP